jgi:hypothetical protein
MRCLPHIDAADCDGHHRIIEYRHNETATAANAERVNLAVEKFRFLWRSMFLSCCWAALL